MMPVSLIVAARRLADVLDLENDALRAMDLRRATGLVADKTAAIAGLTAAGDAAVGYDDPMMVTVARRLDGLARENRRLLERALAAQHRVIGIVVRAAASAGGAEAVYGAAGRMARASRPVALSTRV
jgi:hypothetical protein